MYKNAEEGRTYKTNMPGIFPNGFLTMKSKVKGNMGIKLKNAPIRLKYISNSSSSHKEWKSQLHDIHTMFRCQDKGKNREKVNDLSYRGQIFKMVQLH